MKKIWIGAAALALCCLAGTAGAEAAEGQGDALKIKNKEWKGETLFLRDGRVYGAPETLARGGRWEITREDGAYFVSVPVGDDGGRETVRLPVGADGLADLTFFGDQAGLKFKLNEKKREIKFDKPKKPEKKKKDKKKDEKKKSIKNSGEVFIMWDPDMDFAPDRPFFDDEDQKRIVSPGWGTYANISAGKRYYPISYIDRAQAAGVAVMPMINNDFDPDATSAFLKDEGERAQFLRRLAAYTEVYGLDGWNIDFENMDPKDAAAFTDFVADVADEMHERNKKVSVDITAIGDPGSYWSGCCDRKGLAEHADWEILMGYDQTAAASPYAGPVSAYDWLDRVLPPLLEEIPADQLVLGLPFYTRVWTGDDGSVSSDVLTLLYTDEFTRKHKIVPRWQKKERMFYADWRENGVRRRVWLEENRSLAEKLKLLEKYDLGGAAFWRYGFETSAVYSALDEAL